MTTSSAFTKRVQTNDRGNPISWGSDDIDKLYATLSGEKNVGPATLESNWAFRNTNLRLQNPAKLYEVAFNTSQIASDNEIIIPRQTNNDTMVLQNQDQELTNKLLDARLNNLLNIETTPIVSKSGRFEAVGDGGIAGGSGILQTLRHVVLPQSRIDSTGTYYRYKTPSTTSGKAGVTVPGLKLTRAAFDPSVTFKFRLPNWTINTMRMYGGLVADQHMHQSDIAYSPSTAAILFGFASNDGIFRLFRNIGDGVTTTQPLSLGVNIDQEVHTVKFGLVGQGTFAYVQLDNNEEQTVSIELPQTTQDLTMHIEVQNVDTLNSPREFDLYHINIQTDQITSVVPTPTSALVSGSPIQLFSNPITFADYIDFKIIATAPDPPAGNVRLYAKQVDANNDGLFMKSKLLSTVQEVRVL